MDLVDLLAQALELEFISSLPLIRIPEELAPRIFDLPEEGFTAGDYSRLASYVTGADVSFECVADAKRAIADAMTGRAGAPLIGNENE